MAWTGVLAEQQCASEELGYTVSAALGDASLSRRQVAAIWEETQIHCRSIRRLIENLEDCGAPFAVLEQARILEDVFVEVHKAVGERLISLRRSY